MSEKSKKKKHVSTKRMALRLWVKLVILFVVILVLFNFVFDITIVQGNEMFPAVRDGDLVVSYRLDSYIPSDAVIYVDPNGEKRTGRVIAEEGSVIDINEAGLLTVDGYQPSEEVFYATSPGDQLTYPYTVPDGTVFILNDFRSETDDSRTFGGIDKKKIHGPLIYVIRRRGF